MNFSFNTTAGASQSTVGPKLKGDEIHEVTFEGCEIKDIQGVKNPNEVYKVLILKFSNSTGDYEHTVFEPSQEKGDFERKSMDFGTNTVVSPSNVESMMLLFKHAIDTINPDIAKAIDEGTKNLGAKNWNDLRALVAKILDAGKGTQTKIKLITNKKGEGVFPGFFSGLTRDGKPYVRNNFIGTKVAFSSYELDKMNKRQTATPTNTDDFALGSTNRGSEDTSGLDLDFDI